MTLHVRKAHENEHKLLVEIAKTSKYTKDFSNQVMFSSLAAYEKGWIRLVTDGHGPLGFYCVRHKTRSPETMLYFITVLPVDRSVGLGKLLMDDMKEQSPSGKIALNVAKENRAVNFYAREGFQIIHGDALAGTAYRMEWRR